MDTLAQSAVTPDKLAFGPHVGIIPAATMNSNGNKSITGLGFKPRVVEFTTLPASNSTVSRTGTGAMSADTQFATSAGSQIDQSGVITSKSDCILYSSSNGGTLLKASYVSMDEDGFTINVTTANSYDIGFKAYP